MDCELVCTGWYSDSGVRAYTTHGDDIVRGPNFRSLWWQSMDRFVRPTTVLVVDSASPIKSDDRTITDTTVVYVDLQKNPGHSQNCVGHYCGYMASVILGMEFAMHNDAEFFLYVEQDALIYGDRFIPIIKKMLMKNDVIFGSAGESGDIEQSVFAVSKRSLRKFIANLHRIDFSDRQISPEMKFMYAASKLRCLPMLGLSSWDRSFVTRRFFTRLIRSLMPFASEYATLPFGYGRVRPINFSDETFYFQQGTASEIAAYRKKLTEHDATTDQRQFSA